MNPGHQAHHPAAADGVPSGGWGLSKWHRNRCSYDNGKTAHFRRVGGGLLIKHMRQESFGAELG